MNAENRLELILSATDKASAHMQAVRKEIEAVAAASRRANTGAASTGKALETMGAKSSDVRRAAMAMSSIAYAAESATMGTRTAVLAVGTLAEAAVASSARFAMWSPHIAAAAIVAGSLLAIVQRLRSEAANVKNPFAGVLQNLDPSQAELFHQRMRENKERAARAVDDSKAPVYSEERDRLRDGLNRAIVAEQEAFALVVRARSDNKRKARDDAIRAEEQLAQELGRATEKRGELLAEIEGRIATSTVRSQFEAEQLRVQQQFQSHAAEIRALEKHGLDVVELTVANERWKQAELSRIRDEGLNQALALEADLGSRIQVARAQAADDQYRAEEARINQEAGRRLVEIEAMAADEERKNVLRAQSAELQSAEIEAASRRDQERQRQAAAALHEQRMAQVRALVLSQKSIARALVAFALEPIVKQLEGVAIQEGILALKSFWNPFAAAKHAAVAGAALLAARKVAALGGLGGGGGGGGSAGSGGDVGVGRFEPQASGGAGSGAGTIHIITRDPYGRESIQETMHHLQRAGMLKAPARVEIPHPFSPRNNVSWSSV